MKTYCNFILKFIWCTSVLCLLYVYIENKRKIINLKKISKSLKYKKGHTEQKIHAQSSQ